MRTTLMLPFNAVHEVYIFIKRKKVYFYIWKTLPWKLIYNNKLKHSSTNQTNAEIIEIIMFRK